MDTLQYVGNNYTFSVWCETCIYQYLEYVFSSGSRSSDIIFRVTPGNPIRLC